MNQKELIDLANLLAKFHNHDFGHNGSMYGRNMDRAMAGDLHTALHAYGISGYLRDEAGGGVQLDKGGNPIEIELIPLLKA